MGWWILVLVLVKKAVKYFKKCTQSDTNKNKQQKKSFKVSEEHTKEIIEGKSEVDINENMNNNDGVESSEIPSHHCELPSPHSDITSEHSGITSEHNDITSEHSDIPSEHTKTYSTNISTIEAKDDVSSSDSSEASEDLSSSESSENISCDFSFNRR